MKKKQSKRLIVKFITNQASQEERELLTKWLEDTDNQKVFKDFVKTNYAIDYAMNTFDTAKAKKKLLRRIGQDNSIFYRQRIKMYFKYAAIIIGLAVSTIYFYQKDTALYQKDNLLVPKEEMIILQSDNGSTQIINPLNSGNFTDKTGKIIGKQDKSKIIYSDDKSTQTLVYNTLKIPYGKRFEIELSDGTIVHMNSGTTLRYPVAFLKNQSRKVFLTGEAFFEVAKDKDHPFTVNTQELSVEVLGTKFNASSYTDDVTTDIVLVEGKVGLYKGKKASDNWVKLTPGLKGSTTKGQQNITTEKVNTDIYTAWIKGSLVFKNMPFDAIIKKLERHYNVTFINKNKTLGKEIFNASFDQEPIAAVLKYFSDSYNIDYKIIDNKIIIK